jgi:hypothetical protein
MAGHDHRKLGLDGHLLPHRHQDLLDGAALGKVLVAVVGDESKERLFEVRARDGPVHRAAALTGFQ